jgi:hypothetical protein
MTDLQAIQWAPRPVGRTAARCEAVEQYQPSLFVRGNPLTPPLLEAD